MAAAGGLDVEAISCKYLPKNSTGEQDPWQGALLKRKTGSLLVSFYLQQNQSICRIWSSPTIPEVQTYSAITALCFTSS